MWALTGMSSTAVSDVCKMNTMSTMYPSIVKSANVTDKWSEARGPVSVSVYEKMYPPS